MPASLPDIVGLQSIDLVLLSNCNVQSLFDLMASLKATRPDLRVIVTGSGDEETILQALVAGAKGYVHEAASAAEFVQAVRVVSQGSVWAPRHVFSMFIERVSSAPARSFPAGRATFTEPGEGSPGVAGRRPLQQGNRVSPRHWGAYSESPCGQAAAESRRAESYRALGSRPNTFAGYRKIEVQLGILNCHNCSRLTIPVHGFAPLCFCREKKAQPKTAAHYPLSDLRRCSRREVRA